MNYLAMGAVGLMVATAGVAVAETPYDGLYYPTDAQGWSCETGDLGAEQGAVGVMDNALWGVENTCELRDPTHVRGMQATLYDAVCSAEGSEYSYRLMLLASDTGIYLIEDGLAVEWTRCD